MIAEPETIIFTPLDIFLSLLRHPGTILWSNHRLALQKISSKQSMHLVACHRANKFFSTPPKSLFKRLFQGTDLGEALRKMSSAKSPKGLKVVECERGVGGKNALIRYIPEQDPVQDALDKTKKTTYFKLTLPNTGNKLKVAIWASGTPEQFLLHVHTAMHICK